MISLKPAHQNHVRGASGGNRTHDQLITNQLLYRLSYAGILHRRGKAPAAKTS